MRLALISDIHGNQVALEAVLADIEKGGADHIVCLGDVATLGPCPRLVIGMLRDLGCLCVMGNHDAFLFKEGLVRSYTDVQLVLDAVLWCQTQVRAEDVDFLRAFKPKIEMPVECDSTVYLCHGSPRSFMEDVLSTTPDEQVDEILHGISATVVAGGHTHLQMLRKHKGILIVNPGSVGLPFKERIKDKPPTVLPYAEYALVDVDKNKLNVDLRCISLDKKRLRNMVRACDYPFRDYLLEQYA